MKKTFEIEFPDDCGPTWLNKDNLLLCLTTEHCTLNAKISVKDITEGDSSVAVSKPRCDTLPALPITGDETMELAIERAARVWKKKKLSNKEMDFEDFELALEFANALYEVYYTGRLDADIKK